MATVPWKSFASAEPERQYLVLASRLPLRRFSATVRFGRRATQVRRQLASASGLIGYSLMAKPFTRMYWTLSVWNDEEALQTFVAQSPHSEVMSALLPDMGPTRFVRWSVSGSQLPPTWSEALEHLDAA
jgi:heme-degrading monooxygenase HmoA